MPAISEIAVSGGGLECAHYAWSILVIVCLYSLLTIVSWGLNGDLLNRPIVQGGIKHFTSCQRTVFNSPEF